MVASSANAWMEEDTEESKSFIKRRKSVGDSAEPCGTPAFTVRGSEFTPSKRTSIERPCRKLPIHLMRTGCRPYIGSLASRPACQTLSNAFEISNETTSDSPNESKAEDQRCVTYVKRSPVER